MFVATLEGEEMPTLAMELSNLIAIFMICGTVVLVVEYFRSNNKKD